MYPYWVTITDRSGEITTGGTAQTAVAANTRRRYLFIQNISTNDNLWFNFTTTAVQDRPSIKLTPGSSYEMAGIVSTEAISVIGPTTGQDFVIKEA